MIQNDLTALEEKRFQILRDWRKAKAAELDVPAFVVFGDKTLRDLARKNPRELISRGIQMVLTAKQLVDID